MLHLLKFVTLVIVIASARLTLSVYDSIDSNDCEKAKRLFCVTSGLVFLLIVIITIIFTVPSFVGFNYIGQ